MNESGGSHGSSRTRPKVAVVETSGSDPTTFPVIVISYVPATLTSYVYSKEVAVKVALPSVSCSSNSPSKMNSSHGIVVVSPAEMLVHSYSTAHAEGSTVNGFSSHASSFPLNLSLAKSS